jgi:hypothetical protein
MVMRLPATRAEWRQSLNACLISIDFLRSGDASSPAVAATIVHELMHARLDSLGFDYREEQRSRVERICYRRARRFLERLPDSDGKVAALADADAGLALDAGTWSTVQLVEIRRRQLWRVRLWRFLVARLSGVWRRDAPT